MNIFEQFGIKEVADCTLYAIELNKYDEEIYIPVLYFDTLKVSTIEKSAQQTSARGGIGNSELIIWDYGKEITVTLEDALYTPASQSLMWGGKFGIKHSKIYGVWNPFVYPKDRFGKSIYLEEDTIFYDEENNEFYSFINNEKNVITISEDEIRAIGYQKVICFCDGSIKYIRKRQSEKGKYKYLRKEGFNEKSDQLLPVDALCPKEKVIHETENGGKIKRYISLYNSDEPALDNQLKLKKWKDRKRPEIAYITIDNFEDFDYRKYQLYPYEDNEDCYYSEKLSCEDGCSEQVDAYGYIWNNAGLKLSSLEGDQDISYIDNSLVRIRLPKNSQNKEISISKRGIFRKDDLDLANEIFEFTKDDLIYDKEGGLVYKNKPFDSKIDFYKNIKWKVTNENGKQVEKISKVKIGTFYIIEDWNLNSESPNEMIFPIESGIENTQVLERMEHKIAKKTFAINSENNLKMSNYSQMKQYDNQPLTVYLDPKTMKPFESNSDIFYTEKGDMIKGSLRIIKQNEKYLKWSRSIAPKYTQLGGTIVVDAKHFPGAFKLVGETFARERGTQKDQHYQFEIPLCKLDNNNNLTLQAAGDPTTFSMSLKVLRKEDGTMMKLTQYQTDGDNVLPIHKTHDDLPFIDDGETYWETTFTNEIKNHSLEILSPEDSTTYQLEYDEEEPYNDTPPYIESSNDIENLDRSKVVVKENWTETENKVKVEYEDKEFTIPTGEITKETQSSSEKSKILSPNEFEFDIEEG